MRILAIESSCDETSAAVLDNSSNTIHVLSNVTATSLTIHKETGGIIPENAAREQVKWIIPVIIQALLLSNENKKHNAKDILINEIDAIAVTQGPGLIGSLLVGVETAKTLAFSLSKPLIPVNHLLAHIYANYIDNPTISYPFVGLIVSGGHTDLLYFHSKTEYTWLGGTRDDAAGEALDKIGRLLDLSYPAGPEIERRAGLASNKSIKFHSPLLHSDDFDFSFSGLKTEALREIIKLKNSMNEDLKNDICFAVQKAIIDVLVAKTVRAVKKYNVKSVLIGGGVSANTTLKSNFVQEISKLPNEITIYSPKISYCTDNAAMIGAFALLNGEEKNWEYVKANPELYFT